MIFNFTNNLKLKINKNSKYKNFNKFKNQKYKII